MEMTSKVEEQFKEEFRDTLIKAIEYNWKNTWPFGGRIVISFHNKEFQFIFDECKMRGGDPLKTGEFYNICTLDANQEECMHDASECYELGCDEECQYSFIDEQICDIADEMIDDVYDGWNSIVSKINKINSSDNTNLTRVIK